MGVFATKAWSRITGFEVPITLLVYAIGTSHIFHIYRARIRQRSAYAFIYNVLTHVGSRLFPMSHQTPKLSTVIHRHSCIGTIRPQSFILTGTLAVGCEAIGGTVDAMSFCFITVVESAGDVSTMPYLRLSNRFDGHSLDDFYRDIVMAVLPQPPGELCRPIFC